MFALNVTNPGVIFFLNARTIVFLKFCDVCGKKDDSPTPSLSPITNQCDPSIASKLHNILPSLLSLDFEEQLEHDQWQEF